MKLLNYRILIRKEPGTGYTVMVPSLPGCVTFSDTIEEGIEMAKEAIQLYIESLKEHGEEIPTEEGTLEYEAKFPAKSLKIFRARFQTAWKTCSAWPV